MLDLKNLIETEKLEFKRELPESKKFASEVIAMANSKGGRLILGFDEKTRTIIDCNPTQRLEEKIANIISHYCTPQIPYFISYETINSKSILIVEIEEGSAKPYHLKDADLSNGTFIRIGSTTRKADQETLRRLLREGQNLSYDLETVSLPVELNKKRLLTFLEKRKSRFKTKSLPINPFTLEDLGLSKKSKPTVAGTLLFSNLPQQLPELQNAIIQAARFKGSEKGIFLDQTQIDGPLPDQIENCTQFIKRNIRLMGWIKELKRVEHYEYPLEIIRELITNAVVHRDYSISGSAIQVAIYDDYLEVTSPGGLPGNVTPENIVERQYSRNPVIAKRMFEFGYFDSWGQGIDQVVKWTQENQLPSPQFIENGNQFTVKICSLSTALFKNETKSETKIQAQTQMQTRIHLAEPGLSLGHEMSDTENNVLSLLNKKGKITNQDCQKNLNLTKTQAQVALRKLERMQKILRKGAGRATYYISRHEHLPF